MSAQYTCIVCGEPIRPSVVMPVEGTLQAILGR